MIFYTEQTLNNLEIAKAVERNQQGDLVEHTNGTPIGIVMQIDELEGSDPLAYAVKVYVAGGGGQSIKLGSDWDGLLSRFEIVEGYARPTSNEGHGWLIPSFPSQPKVEGEIVQAALY